MSKLTESIEHKIQKDIEGNELELEYVELVKEGKENILRIVIDKINDKISVEDCEKLSRQIEDKVDEMVKIEGGYILEVSSAGLERQIKNERLFQKYKGYNVRIKLFSKINDKKEFVGILENTTDSEIYMNVDGEEIKIELKNIASANTIYDFKF